MKLWVRAEVLRLTNMRASQMRAVGTPGPEGSIGKLPSAELNKEITELRRRPARRRGDALRQLRDGAAHGHDVVDTPQKAFLRCRANSIEGGTSEVMRNILGERVLGLPGDVRVDKDLPWSQVPRSLARVVLGRARSRRPTVGVLVGD